MRNIGDQLGNQVGFGREIAINRPCRDIGPGRDRGDLDRGHPTFRSRFTGGIEDSMPARRKTAHDLMSSAINH